MSGGLSEETSLREIDAYILPDNVSAHAASGFELNYGTVYHGLVDLGNLTAGETLLVLGASGGVGMAAIDIGKAIGANVIACASTENKLEACKRAGADELINYEGGDFKALLKDSGYYGSIDVVFDPVGGNFSEPALRALDWAGRFIVVGFAAGGVTPKDAIPRVPLNLILLNERRVIGLLWGAWKARDDNEANTKNVETMIKWMQDGKLKPLVSKVCTFDNYVEAFDDLMNRRAVGKLCIEPRSRIGGSARL